MEKEIYIIKANGEKELFDSSKLENSLRRAGADKKKIFDIVTKIESSLEDKMTTAEIYRAAFKLLNEDSLISASKYSLKKAVMSLGPQGFVFEDFMGAVFKKLGYKVMLRNNIKGLCVSHEVDLVAQNEEKFLMAEIKFHNHQGLKSDLKVVLYVKERFDDIAKGEFFRNINKNLKKENWLITNTKFSSQAVQYAECNPDLNLMSWDYPPQNNLFGLIGETGLYPITVLNSLSSNDKKRFLEKNILLCRDILDGGELLMDRLDIPTEKAKIILKEIKELLK
ncbi:ATPase [Patescibacteria group bacterium]|nr:ATPase [Patescibacteria group bacterium]